MKQLEKVSLLLVEDEDSFVELMKVYLKLIGISKIWIAQDYQESIEMIAKHSFDIYLLDINLGFDASKNGIDVAQHIRALHPRTPIIFLTSLYDQAMYQEAKVVAPSNFLSKNLSKLSLLQAIELALESSSTNVTPNTNIKSIEKTDQIFFKVGQTYKVIPLEDISYFYAEQKNVFGQVEKRNYLVEVALKTLTQKLYPHFLRVHKTYLVNKSFIKLVNPKQNVITLQNDQQIPIGYTYRKNFFKELNILR